VFQALLATLALAPVMAATSSSNSLTQWLIVGISFLCAFGAVFWASLIIWTWRDIRARSQDMVLQVAATLLVTVFFVGGLFIYLILRPRHTLAEMYERQLEEESLLAEMTERPTCPTCHYRVEADFQVCPSCGTKLRRPCPRCEHLLELKWNVCPYCAYGASEGRQSSRPSGVRAGERG
jgi:RNA polymerase subunit RPABC4/transcription elongation factor Spt4